MSAAPIDPQQALLATLQQAAFGYGIDLLLAVPQPDRARTPTPSNTDSPAPAPRAPAPDPTAVEPALAPASDRILVPPPSASGSGSGRTPPAGPSRPLAAARAPVPPAPAEQVAETDPLLRLRTEVLACKKCKLCETRRAVVFGEGHRTPDVLFVGEAPGAVEDQTGRPFVGPAGQLLDRILEGAMGLARQDVFIANVNKCRPPGNRDPEPDEVAACLPYLRQQVELLAPKVIVALGRVAAHNLLDTQAPMRELRGRDLHYAGIPVVVTWHPAYLLRDPSRKVETWADIKRVNRLLGRPEDPRRSPPAGA